MIHLFNRISIPYGLFNAETQFIYKYLVTNKYFQCSITIGRLHSYMGSLFQSNTDWLNE